MASFADAMALTLFGMTIRDAIEAGVCIRCKYLIETLDPFTDEDAREYSITALCPICWDELTPEEDE